MRRGFVSLTTVAPGAAASPHRTPRPQAIRTTGSSISPPIRSRAPNARMRSTNRCRRAECLDGSYYLTAALLFSALANTRHQQLLALEDRLAARDPLALLHAVPEITPESLDRELRAWEISRQQRIWKFTVRLARQTMKQRTLGDAEVLAGREVIVVIGVVAQAVLDDQDALLGGGREPVAAPQLRTVVGRKCGDLFPRRAGSGRRSRFGVCAHADAATRALPNPSARESMPDLPGRSVAARTNRRPNRIGEPLYAEQDAGQHGAARSARSGS